MRTLRIPIIAPACAAAAWLAILAPAAAQTCPAVPVVDCLEPRPLAEADGARFAWGVTAGETADAWVARFERGAKEPSWRVQLGGSGADSVSTVTLNRGGAELLVAGATTSPTLSGFTGRNAGGRDGFVARLDAKTGRLLSGAFVGGVDDEELSGVVSDRAGNILVTGIGKLPAFGVAPADLTVVEPNAAPGPGSPVFLATLDSKLTRQLASFAVGPVRTQRPRAWIDCFGNVVIGVAAMSGDDCGGGWPDLVYEQDQIAADYDLDHDWNDTSGNLGFPPGGWGYHAMRWKDYHANAQQQLYTLDWGLLPSSPAIPKDWNPTCSDAGTLNQLETMIFLDNNNTPADPPGGWSCGNHANVAQLALHAAHFFHRWGTPVYTHLGFWDDLNSQQQWLWETHPVALERVRFRPFCPFSSHTYNGETLDDLCDLGVNDVSQLTCTSNNGIPGVDGGNFYLRFEEFEGAMWGLELVWWGRLMHWQRDIDWWWQEWYEPGEYLLDPPPASGNQVAILQEAARQSAGRVVRQGDVLVTRLTNGVATCKSTVDAVLPASE